MSSTAAAIGYGYALSTSATSGGTYVAIAEIVDLKPGKTTRGKSEVARSDATTPVIEKVPGWFDVGDWEVKVVYSAAYRAILEALNLAGMQYWKFTRPGGSVSSMPFQAFMCELGDETPLKEFMSCDFKLCVSGMQSLS